MVFIFLFQEGLDGWEVTASGGDGFLVEEEAGGCNPIQEVNEDAEGKTHFQCYCGGPGIPWWRDSGKL